MGPKKRGKKSKKKKNKVKEEKPAKPLRSEYLAKIAERNAALAAAKKRFQKVEDAYFNTEKKYEETKEDMADIIKYLRHEIEQNEMEVAAFNEKIATYQAEIEQNNKYYQEIFVKMEIEFQEKEKALNRQIEQNAAKLSSLEEVRLQREEYLRRKEALFRKLREMEARHREEIYLAEKQAIIKQDTKQKEMESNLIKLAVDFRQASDIAIGDTTNKLIRQNIELGNVLTCTQEIFEKVRNTYAKACESEKKYRYNSELLEEENSKLDSKFTSQVHKIETFFKAYDELCEQIKMSERLSKDNRRLQRQIVENECILKEKVTELNDLLKVLKHNEEFFKSLKIGFNLLRRNVVKLDFLLYEAAKKVKYGLEVERMSFVMEDKGEEVSLEVSKDELEENLKEFRYKARETTIGEIIETLRNGVSGDGEYQLEGASSESRLVIYRENPSSTDQNR